MKITISMPRTVCPYPMYLQVDSDRPLPVRLRDDLDSRNPPEEYADGRVMWSGHPTREARDAAQLERWIATAKDEAERAVTHAKARTAMTARLIGDAWTRIKAGGIEFGSSGDERCFSGPVNMRGENPAAHGNVCVIEHAKQRFILRSVNINGRQREEGNWRPDMVAIQAEVAK